MNQLHEKGTIYLSGRIVGVENANRGTFKLWKEKLEGKGYKVIIPQLLFDDEILDNLESNYTLYMRTCIRAMMLCEAVYTLPDWYESKESAIEVDIARSLQMEVVSVLSAKQITNNKNRT